MMYNSKTTKNNFKYDGRDSTVDAIKEVVTSVLNVLKLMFGTKINVGLKTLLRQLGPE